MAESGIEPPPPVSGRERVMPGHTNTTREYFRYAAENDACAVNATDPKLKAAFLQIAREYRKLAAQLDAPWE